jgi:flagellar biosynthesis chaperone FliJ
MDVTREWMEEQLPKLELDLAEAKRRMVMWKIRLDKARNNYAAAQEEAETASGIIRYFRQELELGRLTAEVAE